MTHTGVLSSAMPRTQSIGINEAHHASLTRSALQGWLKDHYTSGCRSIQRHGRPIIMASVASVTTVGAAAAAASVTITPFLHGFKCADSTVALLGALPAIGPALGGIIGGTALSCIASSALLVGTVATLCAPRDDSSVGIKWILAHAALGFALSPLLLQGVAATAGIGACGFVGASAIALSVTLSTRYLGGRTTWKAALAGVILTLAVAPATANLAAGAAVSSALGGSVKAIGAGAIIGAVYEMYTAWPRFVSNKTSFLDPFMAPKEDIEAAVLDLSAQPSSHRMRRAKKPTVFGVPDTMRGLIALCKQKMSQGQHFGMRRGLLHGPPGCGKTEMARGLARELNATLLVVSKAMLALQGGESACAANIYRLFEEARSKQKETGRPVVIFFDEAETIFANRQHLHGKTQEERGESSIITTLLQCIDGACKPPDDNMVVLAATNYREHMDSAARSRFLLDFALSAPDARSMGNIIESQLNKRFPGIPIEPNELATCASQAKSQGWVGRDVQSWAERLEVACQVHNGPVQRWLHEQLTGQLTGRAASSSV